LQMKTSQRKTWLVSVSYLRNPLNMQHLNSQTRQLPPTWFKCSAQVLSLKIINSQANLQNILKARFLKSAMKS
jgi:hypothetical protein